MSGGPVDGRGSDETWHWPGTEPPPASPAAPAGVPTAYRTPPAAPTPTPTPAPAPAAPAARTPVAYQPAEHGWWLATDNLWYPPESRPVTAPAPAPIPSAMAPMPPAAPMVPVHSAVPAPGPMSPGYGYPTATYAGPQKSKVAAGLLALFLGTLGIHRFYLGYTGVGVAMLLITVLSLGILAPIVAIWALIEAVVIFCGGMKAADGRPLS